jgi:HEAT repeat protein
LDAIAEYLTHDEAAIRTEAVLALGWLQEKSQDYVNDVLKLLKRNDNPPAVKAAAAVALGRMKNTGQKVIAALIRLTEEDNPDSFPTVFSACQALAFLHVNSGEVMNAMYKVLEHKSLAEHQKMIIKRGIEEIENPLKKPLAKDPGKNPDKGNAPKQSKRH